jgi:hypothetical protein
MPHKPRFASTALCRQERSRGEPRERGSVAILALIIVTFLAALSMAQYSVAQKSLQSARYFSDRVGLRAYAESGIEIAFHDFNRNVTGNDGKIGTVDWTEADDFGVDAYPGTGDEGEGDGRPSRGEPNVVPAPVGPGSAGLFVWVEDLGAIHRIVSTAFDGDNSVTLEKQVQEIVAPVPRVGAAYVDPDVALDLKGNSFIIDGDDHNPDGTDGPGEDLHGLTTAEGDPPGDNEAALLAQIDGKHYDQILGVGGEPSIGEASGVDIDALVAQYESSAHTGLASGTYSNVTWGDWDADDLRILVAEGDIHLSGTGEGAGVLVVDGDLTMSGQFTFYGLVIVRGDIKLAGGGAGIHVWGTVLVKESIANTTESELTVSGTTEIYYSSAVLDKVEQTAYGIAGYEVVYYGEGY